jgi:hypothetical protein
MGTRRRRKRDHSSSHGRLLRDFTQSRKHGSERGDDLFSVILLSVTDLQTKFVHSRKVGIVAKGQDADFRSHRSAFGEHGRTDEEGSGHTW